MSITVKIDLGYEFEVKPKAAEVFEVLSDVPTSVSHFPKVEQLTDMGGGVYKWEMEKVGTAQVNIQTVYASKYVSDAAKGTVKWTPVKGVGNALVGGNWKIVDNKKSTGVTLAIQGEIEVPLPGLMKMIVVPVVQGEFEKLVEKYIDNLIKRFGGQRHRNARHHTSPYTPSRSCSEGFSALGQHIGLSVLRGLSNCPGSAGLISARWPRPPPPSSSRPPAGRAPAACRVLALPASSISSIAS
jgi:carbon monoxide dehydrogenase subunit G